MIPNEKNYLLQQIIICNNKKEVSYVFEFPDKTLFVQVMEKYSTLSLPKMIDSIIF